MNWKDTLEVIKPLVSERGYLEAKAFVLTRKTYEHRGLFFKRIEETEFTVSGSLYGDGIVLRSKHTFSDFIIVY